MTAHGLLCARPYPVSTNDVNDADALEDKDRGVVMPPPTH